MGAYVDAFFGIVIAIVAMVACYFDMRRRRRRVRNDRIEERSSGFVPLRKRMGEERD